MEKKNNSHHAGIIYYQCFSPPQDSSLLSDLILRIRGWSELCSHSALCQKPKIENGGVTAHKDQYVEPENVTVQCNDGYGMVGSPKLTCSKNGMWLPAVPKCKWVSGTHFRISYHILKLVIGVRALSTNVDEIWFLSGLTSEWLKSASKHLMSSLKQVLILSFSSKKNQTPR